MENCIYIILETAQLAATVHHALSVMSAFAYVSTV